ncbi:MAG: hypothetical protein Q4Q62_02535 [Thermoplasmata archaeon]|nr:hypothetical protein [Thermoplasmata archaeon]
MRHAKAVVVLAVAIILLGSLMYVRAENERYHHTDDSDIGLLVGEEVREEDFPDQSSRLWVYGNADGDDDIDGDDIAYLEAVIAGAREATTLCDANLDGTVDGDDIAYVQRIIDGDEMDVFYIDNYYLNAKVSWPVETIAIGYCSGAYAADLIGVADKVVMVDTTIESYWYVMNSNYASASSYGTVESPNYEKLIERGIDVYVVGYFDADADAQSVSSLNPAGIDVMFLSTADNSGVDYPNEHIDRTLVMLAFLLQGDMEKTYEYLDWHDGVLEALTEATSALEDSEKAAFIMARTSPLYSTGGISITGLNNTNNIHAEWVGVDAVGQHSERLTKNYQTLTAEQLLALIAESANNNTVYYMDNAHDGIRGQYSLKECVEADIAMLESSSVDIVYMAMAREAGNSPLYVVELAFYVCVMYPELAESVGIDYTELFYYYFENFASEDYSEYVSDIERFFYVYSG